MNIISHRGFWLSPEEKNTRAAFDHTIASGFGTETDVRDAAGRLVVSHDPATGSELSWDLIVDLFAGKGLPLAVNVKADGLSGMISAAFAGTDIPWFAFDMSGPETIRYHRLGLPFYTRHSDVEPSPILYEHAAGVWLDDFQGGWIKPTDIQAHLDNGKAVCVVSPELHGRDHVPLWTLLRQIGADPRITLCTDLPTQAQAFLAR